MKSTARYIALVSLIALGSCSKDKGGTDSSYADSFKFYFNANIDGSPVELKAGQDGYSMYTNYDLDRSENEDGVLSMWGVLSSDENEEDYKNTVILKLRSNKVFVGEGSFDLNEAILEGNIALADASNFKRDPDNFNLELIPDVISMNYNYTWNFEDGRSSTSPNPSLVVNALQNPAYKVTLNADSYNGGCYAKTSHNITIEDDCDATIILNKTHNFGLKASISSRFGQIETVKWFRNGTFIGDELVIPQLAFTGDGNYKIAADVSFFNGCTKRIEKDVNVLGGSVIFCDVDFSYIKSNVKIDDPLQLGTIEMIYYDGNGKRYTSYYANNVGGFRIHAIRPYTVNEHGQRTISFLFEGNATLKSVDGSSLAVNNAFGNYVIAHP